MHENDITINKKSVLNEIRNRKFLIPNKNNIEFYHSFFLDGNDGSDGNDGNDGKVDGKVDGSLKKSDGSLKKVTEKVTDRQCNNFSLKIIYNVKYQKITVFIK